MVYCRLRLVAVFKPTVATGGAPRVLILDENRVGREGIAALLTERAGVLVVGTTASRDLALKMAENNQVDVVLAGSSIIAKDGPLVAREIVRRGGLRGVKVVVIGVGERSFDLTQVADAGVAGYLTKGASVSDLVDMVRAVTQVQGNWVVPKPVSTPEREGPG